VAPPANRAALVSTASALLLEHDIEHQHEPGTVDERPLDRGHPEVIGRSRHPVDEQHVVAELETGLVARRERQHEPEPEGRAGIQVARIGVPDDEAVAEDARPIHESPGDFDRAAAPGRDAALCAKVRRNRSSRHEAVQRAEIEGDRGRRSPLARDVVAHLSVEPGVEGRRIRVRHAAGVVAPQAQERHLPAQAQMGSGEVGGGGAEDDRRREPPPE
jgi:hypothetical protein